MKRIILGIILLGLFSIVQAEPVDIILNRVAQTQDVPAELLRAICQVESGDPLNLGAFREREGGPGNHSFGACQVLLSTSVWLGFQDTGNRCRNYDASKQKAEYTACGLFGPATNFHFAAKYLKWQLKRYKGDWKKAIAAYNAGSARMCPKSGELRNWEGKLISTCLPGEFVNQEYVNKVLQQLKKNKKGEGK